MSKVKAILLIPTEGDPHGLLREGPCGARPPMVYQEIGTDIWRPYRGPLGEGHPENNDALVLAWDGEPVAEGLDRLDWCQHGGRRAGRSAKCVPVRDGVPDTLWRAYANGWLAAHGGNHKGVPGIGTLVLIDAEGREVKNE